MSPQDVVLSTLGILAMVFGLLRFGDWVIVDKLKLNKDPTTYALSWALYISVLINLGVLGPLAGLQPL